MKSFRYILFGLFVLSESCVERIEVPIVENKPALVVDGGITDTPGIHTVKLFLSSEMKEDNDVPAKITGASVKIFENGSMVHDLVEKSDGVYQTMDNFAGVIGSTYWLSITTEEGKIYESTPAILKPAGTLGRIYAEYRENAINIEKPELPQDALYLYADATGSGNPSELLRWRWKAVYQVNTAADKKIRYGPSGPVPDPPFCSGWQFDEESNLVQFDTCRCCKCWVTMYGNAVTLSDPMLNSGNNVSAVYLGYIPVQSIFFHNKLLIEGEQLSVADDVYEFWKLVKVQEEGAQSIFQPNVVKVRGNISCRSDPSEEVFGVFSVSGSSIQRLEIYYKDVSSYITEPVIINNDCRLVNGGVTEKPAFY